MWRATLLVDPADTVVAETLLADEALAITDFEVPGSPYRLIEALYVEEPDRNRFAAGLRGRAVEVSPLDERDWVSESQRDNPPIRTRRFHLHGSHVVRHPAPSVIDLIVDAGLAFGTGRHESTLGCLIMLERLARGWRLRRPVDLGCGSGVLALAIARLWRCPVVAVDIDCIAVDITNANARRNCLGRWITAVHADGLTGRRLGGPGRHDLIVANILARPLVGMAKDVAAALTDGGHLILSGLLSTQEAMVRSAYRRRGARLAGRVVLSGWSTLHLRR